jgi:signal transduction histidine kinase
MAAVTAPPPVQADIGAALERIADLLVPELAARCEIEVLDDGRPSRVAAAARTLAAADAASPPDGDPVRLAITAGGQALGDLVLWTHDGGPLPAADAKFARWIAGYVAAILDSHRLHRDVARAMTARETFFAIASHELRTPLQSLTIQLHSTLSTSRRSLGGVSPQWLTSRLERSISLLGRLTSLVNTFLDVARINSGRIDLSCDDVDLASLVRSVVSSLRDELAWAGCVVTLAAAEPVVGQWDAARLEMVISNLLSNAMKYGAGHPIHVAIQADAATALLIVRDQGPGIAEADQRRIFERFERVAAGSKTSGFGLGLWIVKHIVEAHGGTVAVESTLGAGARFAVTLPRRRAG